jgi:hypothetical protein
MIVIMPSALHAVTKSAGTLETTVPLYAVPSNVNDWAAGAGVAAVPHEASIALITSRVKTNNKLFLFMILYSPFLEFLARAGCSSYLFIIYLIFQNCAILFNLKKDV